MCYPVARLYALLGEKEKALEFLEKAVARHERQVTVLRVVPDFDFLHSEPRFQDLARRVGLPQ
jgi:hypothetical protein